MPALGYRPADVVRRVVAWLRTRLLMRYRLIIGPAVGSFGNTRR